MNNPAVLYGAWNVFVFALYGADKLKAKGNGRRIAERTLLLCAFLGGALGAAAGMWVFRHKTRKLKFTLGVSLAVIFNGLVWIFILKRMM